MQPPYFLHNSRFVRMLLIAAVIGGFDFAGTNAAHAETTTTIPLDNGAVSVAVNMTTNTVYVANSNVEVIAINGATNIATTFSPDDKGTVAIAVNATTNTIFKVNLNDTVRVIDGTTNTVTAVIQINSETGTPTAIATNATTNTIYVANQDNTVSVINGASNDISTTIPVEGRPISVAVNATTNTIYVASNVIDDQTGTVVSGAVSVIDGATNHITTTIPVKGIPGSVAVNTITNTIYTANQDNTVSVINGATNAITTTIPVGVNPKSVAVNATTNTIYVANAASSTSTNGISGTVSVINGATNTVTNTITMVNGSDSIAINPVTNTIYVGNGTGLTVIALASMQCPGAPVSRLKVGSTGHVTPGSPNNLRSAPDPAAPAIGKIPGGAQFQVLQGATCSNGFAWWQVNYNGLIGWTAEGQGTSYFLTP